MIEEIPSIFRKNISIFRENTKQSQQRNTQHNLKEKCMLMLNYSRDAPLHRQGLGRSHLIIPQKVDDGLKIGKVIKLVSHPII